MILFLLKWGVDAYVYSATFITRMPWLGLNLDKFYLTTLSNIRFAFYCILNKHTVNQNLHISLF